MFNLGLKAIKKLCEDQKPLQWHHAKLSGGLFKLNEQPVFSWVASHVQKYHALPQLDTLQSMFPEVKELDTPEPAAYYLDLLETSYFHGLINNANLESQKLLKADQYAVADAEKVLKTALDTITFQRYRNKIVNVGTEGPTMVLQAYHNTMSMEDFCIFGWPYLDTQTGGLMPGDVMSFVGRPALGKTWFMLWSALCNWRRKKNILFVSMEMAPLPIVQRLVALYSGTNIGQLKTSQFSDITYKKMVAGLKAMVVEDSNLYVVDGNLAACADDIFILADLLGCEGVWVDGAYLLRHKNPKLDRFTRAAENVELMKHQSSDSGKATCASWQFNREASKKQKKTGESGDLDDIGYSDAIGQISSVVLGLFQEEGVETMKQRKIRVLKGRNGETGQLEVNWNFNAMDFSQVQSADEKAVKQLEYV